MVLAWAAVVVFLAAAGRDLGWRIIDDRLVVCLLLAWGGHAVLSGWSAATIGTHLAVGGLAFAVALVLGLSGWMGGGDVKLAAAVFVWAGPAQGVPVLVVVVVAGLVLALLGAAADVLLRRFSSGWVGRGLGVISARRGVPYGVALAFGGALAAVAMPTAG